VADILSRLGISDPYAALEETQPAAGEEEEEEEYDGRDENKEVRADLIQMYAHGGERRRVTATLTLRGVESPPAAATAAATAGSSTLTDQAVLEAADLWQLSVPDRHRFARLLQVRCLYTDIASRDFFERGRVASQLPYMDV